MDGTGFLVALVALLIGCVLGALAARLRSATRIAQLTTEIGHVRSTADEKIALLRAEQERFGAEYERVSQAALRQNRDELADVTLKPLIDQLSRVEAHANALERTRAEAYAELREQVRGMTRTSEQLRTETTQLVSALRAPQVRGRWGELQLRRVVEAAGMLEHVDFSEQESATTPDGRLRPDLVVKLAGGKHVVIDSKVAFNGYLEAMEARDEATHRARIQAHARHFKTHVDSLGAKKYWDQFTPAPEFVVMFVPADAFLNAALEEEPTLLEHAFDRNVVIATPATLVAMLRTIAYTWRQEALARNAQEVLDLGKQLHSRLSTMGGHLSKLGRQLDSAVKAYNDGISSLESRVLVTARKMVDLKVVSDEVDAPAQVERVTRNIQAPELVASANDALVAIDDITADGRYGISGPRQAADQQRRDTTG